MAPWFFLRFIPRARRLLAQGRLPALLLAVARKRGRSGMLAGLREDVATLGALCLAWWRGEYRAIDRGAIVTAVAALLYFVAPLDALPDWLPGLGFVDDLAVLAWVMRRWSTELAAFRAWRATQGPQALARVERPLRPDEPMASEGRSPSSR